MFVFYVSWNSRKLCYWLTLDSLPWDNTLPRICSKLPKIKIGLSDPLRKSSTHQLYIKFVLYSWLNIQQTLWKSCITNTALKNYFNVVCCQISLKVSQALKCLSLFQKTPKLTNFKTYQLLDSLLYFILWSKSKILRNRKVETNLFF